jgi:hypothetical protein
MNINSIIISVIIITTTIISTIIIIIIITIMTITTTITINTTIITNIVVIIITNTIIIIIIIIIIIVIVWKINGREKLLFIWIFECYRLVGKLFKDNWKCAKDSSWILLCFVTLYALIASAQYGQYSSSTMSIYIFI